MSLHDEEHISDKTMQMHQLASKSNGASIESASVQQFETSDSENGQRAVSLATSSRNVDSNGNQKFSILNRTSYEEALNTVNALRGFLFPQIAPIRWTTFIILTLLTAIP